MNFELNKNLSVAARKELIKGLTKVAELYFNGDYNMNREEGKVNVGCGICRALFDLNYSSSYGVYDAMEELMFEMGNDHYDSYFEIVEPEQWEPRANMCLFLVEYLKDSIKKEKS